MARAIVYWKNDPVTGGKMASIGPVRLSVFRGPKGPTYTVEIRTLNKLSFNGFYGHSKTMDRASELAIRVWRKLARQMAEDAGFIVTEPTKE